MTNPLRIVQLNLAYSPTLPSPDALLAAYHTLTGWADAVTRAGAEVVTVQRFSTEADLAHGGCRYMFVADAGQSLPDPWEPCERAVTAVLTLEPDVVHVNGLMFPGVVESLRQRLPPEVVIVVQDHSGFVPRKWPWPIDRLLGSQWQRAFDGIDACAFTDRALAERWYTVGLPPETMILELSPAGSTVTPQPAADASAETGIRASPAILWVGRLDSNKDPLAVLDALEIAMPTLPQSHCWMVYGDAPLEAAVRRRVADSSTLDDRVTLVGAVPHDRIGAYFSAADIFVSGSHHEGSGYSLIEAMACGVMPCVTDIPSFRALTGGQGRLWKVGDSTACASALRDLAARDRESERAAVRRRYVEALSWDAIGQRTVSAYRDLLARRTAAMR